MFGHIHLRFHFQTRSSDKEVELDLLNVSPHNASETNGIIPLSDPWGLWGFQLWGPTVWCRGPAHWWPSLADEDVAPDSSPCWGQRKRMTNANTPPRTEVHFQVIVKSFCDSPLLLCLPPWTGRCVRSTCPTGRCVHSHCRSPQTHCMARRSSPPSLKVRESVSLTPPYECFIF